MQRSARVLLPLLTIALMGCGGPARQVARTSHGNGRPQYTWLKKQGDRYPLGQERTPRERPGAVAGKEADKPLTTAVETACPTDVRAEAFAGTGNPTPVAGLYPEERKTMLGTGSLVTARDSSDYYAPADRHWNAKAIVSAPIGAAAWVVGIALQSIPVILIAGAIAFALGLIGSRQCRDREDRGKAFALVGLVLGAAALFFGLMVVILAGL